MSTEAIFITLFIILVLASPIVSIRTIKKIIRIRKTTTYWISALPSTGQVEVIGKAKGTPTQSPFAKGNCLAWKVVIEEKHTTRAHYERGRYIPEKESWSTVYTKTSTLPFAVCDDTGEIPVSAKDFDLDVKCARYDVMTADSIRRLEEWGVKTTGFFNTGKTFRVTEYLVCPGDEIFVNGELESEDGCKTITSVTGPMLISSQGESGLLSSLYRSVVITTLGVIGIGASVLLFLFGQL